MQIASVRRLIVAMHIHHNPITAGSAGVHSAAAAEKAASAERAAETRKKLMKSAAEIEAKPTFGEMLMVSHWPDDRSGQDRGQQHPVQHQTKPEEDEPLTGAVSYWG